MQNMWKRQAHVGNYGEKRAHAIRVRSVRISCIYVTYSDSRVVGGKDEDKILTTHKKMKP